MYQRRRRRRKRRRKSRWHPFFILILVLAGQVAAVIAVQGTEVGQQLLQVLSNSQNPEASSDLEIQESSAETFLGYPELYVTEESSVSQPELSDLRDQYPVEQLRDFDNLKNLYLYDSDYIVPEPELFDLDSFLDWDLTTDFSVEGPKILIFHTHGSEMYADSGPQGVIQVGEYLKDVLESQYGVEVMHDTTLYDQNSQINAYDQMISGVQPILDANPSIQVTIDLHRDGIGGDGRLVTEIEGQDVAQLMIVNGISAEYNWESGQMEDVSYLYNPNRSANLAFSFRLKMASEVLRPGLMRGIYLSSYRYSAFMREKGILLEVGAQGNMLEECFRAMDHFAPVLMSVLQGKG
ncbi:MAG TPA: stage II sporulation protein P [Candidatus Faecimorpha stercoravium]|nr:stage II sporulation protein P [Candidatus Faecimorpha stercoravium]